LLIDRSLNVAMPVDPEPLCVVVPLRVPDPGFVPIATVTGALHVVPAPPAVWIATVMLGVIVEPAAVFEGCATNASLLALEQLAARATGACTNGSERKSERRLTTVSPVRAIDRFKGEPSAPCRYRLETVREPTIEDASRSNLGWLR